MTLSALTTLALALAAPARAQDACASPATSAEIQAAIDTAEGKFQSLDIDGFKAATDQAFALVPCVTDPIDRHLAAELHRYRGLRAFVDRDPERSTKEFAAARSIEPSYTFPTALVPEGNPVLADYAAIDPASGAVDTLRDPASGTFTFDGTAGHDRPASFPTIVQWLGSDGAVTRTVWLDPGQPMFDYPPRPIGQPPPGAPRRRINVPMLAGAGVAAIASGTMYAIASSKDRQYWGTDPTITDPDQLGALRSQTNGLAIGAIAGAGAAVGLGVTAVFVAEW